MTSGNATASPRRPGNTEQRLVEATLELIAEEGSSSAVNLRQVCRRVGCAHTNAYNYFDTYTELRWAAFRRALRIYGEQLVAGLDADMSADAYLRRAIDNLASFPQQQPGLYRFVASDPIDLEAMPPDIMETVTAMKRWFWAVIGAAAGPSVDADDAREVADIVLAYVDGETLNLINGRAIPDEDLAGRVVANALRLFELLVEAKRGRGRSRRHATGTPPHPASIFAEAAPGTT